MLPLPDAHQFNLTGQPSAGLQQASGGVGLRFRAYATQVLQRSGEGAKNVSFDCNSGGWHLRGWRLKHPLQIGCHVQKPPVVGRTTGCLGPMDVLYHSLRTVIARLRAVHCVASLANSMAIGCKKMPCGPPRPRAITTSRGVCRTSLAGPPGWRCRSLAPSGLLLAGP